MNWYIIFENNEKIKDLLVWFNKQPDMKAFIVKSERFWKKDGKKMFIEKPMYPNYIFVETNLDSKEIQTEPGSCMTSDTDDLPPPRPRAERMDRPTQTERAQDDVAFDDDYQEPNHSSHRYDFRRRLISENVHYLGAVRFSCCLFCRHHHSLSLLQRPPENQPQYEEFQPHYNTPATHTPTTRPVAVCQAFSGLLQET